MQVCSRACSKDPFMSVAWMFSPPDERDSEIIGTRPTQEAENVGRVVDLWYNTRDHAARSHRDFIRVYRLEAIERGWRVTNQWNFV